MASFDVLNRLHYLQQEHPALGLYGLLDGAQYLEQTGKRFSPNQCAIALFSETVDAPLAFAGPWLIDAGAADNELIEELVGFECKSYGVSWLIAHQDMQALAQILRLRLETELPDGRRALLRFWDPRILASLVKIFTPEQRREFFGYIFEWHLLLDREKRVRIGSRDV
ncbi:DUF4123 domain-containing protein [Duganella sp. CF458]|uniref:DUF4123 domain-containing protein n=1 Tax=Duganella sp. CF458 TaxID=1884368 RepID=UPI000B85BCB0|nr:DUF4123 domain-containing protein [Duganella sp. CF458]